MSDAWSRGGRDESNRSPLQGGEHHRPEEDREPDPQHRASAERLPAPGQGGSPSPTDEAVANQERAIESGAENAV